ncbi:MAG: adenylate/guanylate cyclase domain-containing protein [Myxococcota bacterium]
MADRSAEGTPPPPPRVLSPRDDEGSPPPPRRALQVLAVTMMAWLVLAPVASSLLGLVMFVVMAAAIVVMAWVERATYRALQARPALARLLLSAALPGAGFVACLAPAIAFVFLVGEARGTPLLVAGIVSAIWFASASTGSLVVVAIDTVVRAAVDDFRRRVQLAVLLLCTAAAAVGIAVYGAVKEIVAAVGAATRGAAPEGLSVDDALLERLSAMGPEEASWRVGLVALGGMAVFLLPAILSACGKLADSVMVRLMPLDRALAAVTEGDLSVAVEDRGGSRELRRMATRFNAMAASLRQTAASLDQRHHELLATHRAAQRFVPFAFLELLGRQTLVEVMRGDQVHVDITVMFTDIRGFTTLAERIGPEATFHFINRYLERMTPIIAGEGGLVSEFTGDGIMALFPEDPHDGVRAAVAMTRALDALNRDLQAEGSQPIAVGIGLQSGPLMLGTLGDDERLSCTVIGDPANTAARVEGMTKQYGSPILIGDGTWARLAAGAFSLREIDRVQAVGKARPVRLFEVLDGHPVAVREAREASRSRFDDAVQAYREGRFAAAEVAFDQLVADDPDDQVAALYSRRCRARDPDDDGEAPWTGVSRLTSK